MEPVVEINSAWQIVIAPIVFHAEVMTEQMGGKIAFLVGVHE